MIVTKKKLCSLCGEYKILWKSFPPTCNSCKSKSPIKKVSDKHKETLKEYNVVREEFLKNYTTCQVKLSPDCTYDKGVYIHHISGKSSKELYLDKNNFIACCNLCNDYLHKNSEESYNKGFMKHRNQTNNEK